ncbi:Substance P receptor [Gryllus bimaculatus]|nr:Substance P receptor [Gryllus bimaculatus]
MHRYEKEVLSRENPRTVKWKMKVIRTTFIVLTVFVIFRVPYTALIFWRTELLRNSQQNQIITDHFVVLWFISRYLIFINAAINPFIYGFSNENFKRALRCMEVSRWLFSGTSGSSDVTPPQKKDKQFEKVQHEIYQPDPKEQPVLQQWMVHPLEGKPKTESTECYI